MLKSYSVTAAAVAAMFIASPLAALQGWASVGELGSIETAKRTHPAVFVPRNVLAYVVNGEDGYVFGGEAVQRFKGNLASSDSRLYREARLDARRNLYKFLTKGDKTKSVEMSGARTLYEYNEGDIRRVVLFVAMKNVSVNTASPNRATNAESPPSAQLLTNMISSVVNTAAVEKIEVDSCMTNAVIESKMAPAATASVEAYLNQLKELHDEEAKNDDQ